MSIYKIKDYWTCEEVWDWLEMAARIDRVMPSAKIQGYKGFWPDIPKDPNEAYGYNEEEPRPDPATNREATIWFHVCQWLVVLEGEYERDIVWSRARRVPFKVLEKRHSCGRTKLNRDLTNCVVYITALLNAKADFQELSLRKAKKMCAQNSGEHFQETGLCSPL